MLIVAVMQKIARTLFLSENRSLEVEIQVKIMVKTERKVFRSKYYNCHEEGHFVRDCPKRNTCTREDPNNPTNKGTKSKDAARDAEDQSPDKCDNEALSVFTSNVVGKSIGL